MNPPVKGPRLIYKLELTKYTRVGGDDKPEAGNTPAGAAPVAIKTILYVRMKKPVGKWLGLTPLPFDAPEYRGFFDQQSSDTATNDTYGYRRKFGGFRFKSFKLHAKTQFTINEMVKGNDELYTEVARRFRTISIGFPFGVTVDSFLGWLKSTSRMGEIQGVTTPHGHYIETDTAVA